MKHRATILFALVVVSPATPCDEVSLDDATSIHFENPARFGYQIVRDPEVAFSASMRFSHYGRKWKDFDLNVFAVKPRKEIDAKALAIEICEKHVRGSVENAVTLREVPSTRPGWYCSFTDASMPPGRKQSPTEFRYLTVGLEKSGDFVFGFDALSDSNEGELFSGFLKTIASFEIVIKH